MEDCTKRELTEALRAINSAIGRSEKAQEKFAQGTAQHTLQRNRIKALQIAVSLISEELEQCNAVGRYTREELEKALAPITSLISKSEKAREKLAQGTWQHTMLSDLLNGLYLASPLLAKTLDRAKAREGDSLHAHGMSR